MPHSSLNTSLLYKLSSTLLLGFFLALPAAHANTGEIIFYSGYGDARKTVMEGRIQTQRKTKKTTSEDGTLRNLKHNTRLFLNDEHKHTPLNLSLGEQRWETLTDDEGYFRVETSSPPQLAPGWHEVKTESGNTTGSGQTLIVPPENQLGLISDLDDTILVSEVTSKRRLLGNSFLKNPAQRQAVPGIAQLYTQVRQNNPYPEATPLFYLSASPRQLHRAIVEFLTINNFPQGILITRRVGVDKASDSLLDTFSYKTRRIEEIFARLPQVRFILAGDDGEKDPEIYDWIRKQYPERVEAIWIRRVHPDPDRPRLENQLDLSEIISNPLTMK